MVTTFNPTKKRNKEKLIVTIDATLMDMIKEIMKGYKTNISVAVNDILEYFKEEVWDKGIVDKTKEEQS